MNEHVGFTGTRHGMTKPQSRALYEALRDLRGEDGDGQQFHHGCCVGADAQAAKVAKSLGYVVYGHPPTDERNLDRESVALSDHVRPARDYMERNEAIVTASGHLVAAPLTDQEELRSGTWATVRRARKAGRGVTLLSRVTAPAAPPVEAEAGAGGSGSDGAA